MDHETTDARRRLAMQIALQLPENAADARHVLALATSLLDSFLVDNRYSDARRRAAALGWQVDAAAEAEAAAIERPVFTRAWQFGAALRASGFGLATLLVTVPLGMAAVDRLGHGGVMALLLGVMVVAAVFGRTAAVVLALASVVAQNLLVMPPAFAFQPPGMLDAVGLVGYLAVALLLPCLISRRDNIRARVVGEVIVVPQQAVPPVRLVRQMR